MAVKAGHVQWAQAICVRFADRSDESPDALRALASAADPSIRTWALVQLLHANPWHECVDELVQALDDMLGMIVEERRRAESDYVTVGSAGEQGNHGRITQAYA